MPTDKPRFSIVLEPEMSEELEAYWHENRYKSKNAAINDLLRSAFASIEREANKSELLGISPAALDIARRYDVLPESAQKLISAVVLFESADVETKNRVISILVDHANEKQAGSSSFSAAGAAGRAEMWAEADKAITSAHQGKEA